MNNRPVSTRAAYVGEYWRDANMTADVAIVDDDPVKTGLLDNSGRSLVRIKDRIGFVRWEKRP